MISIDGFKLTNIEMEGIFYKLTFTKEIDPETLQKDKPPKVVKVHKEDDDNIEDGLHKYTTGIIEGIGQVMTQYSTYSGQVIKGPEEHIHMHLLKTDNPWVKELHIEGLHRFDIGVEKE